MRMMRIYNCELLNLGTISLKRIILVKITFGRVILIFNILIIECHFHIQIEILFIIDINTKFKFLKITFRLYYINF